MAVGPTVEAVVQAGGVHIPPLLQAVEERLATLAAGHGHVLARHAGDTIAAGGKRLRPLLVLVVAGEAPGDRVVLVGSAGHRDDHAIDELVPTLAILFYSKVVSVRCPAR